MNTNNTSDLFNIFVISTMGDSHRKTSIIGTHGMYDIDHVGIFTKLRTMSFNF